jgi:hypothetical protein
MTEEFSWFSSVSPNAHRFLPNPFQFIIHFLPTMRCYVMYVLRKTSLNKPRMYQSVLPPALRSPKWVFLSDFSVKMFCIACVSCFNYACYMLLYLNRPGAVSIISDVLNAVPPADSYQTRLMAVSINHRALVVRLASELSDARPCESDGVPHWLSQWVRKWIPKWDIRSIKRLRGGEWKNGRIYDRVKDEFVTCQSNAEVRNTWSLTLAMLFFFICVILFVYIFMLTQISVDKNTHIVTLVYCLVKREIGLSLILSEYK